MLGPLLPLLRRRLLLPPGRETTKVKSHRLSCVELSFFDFSFCSKRLKKNEWGSLLLVSKLPSCGPKRQLSLAESDEGGCLEAVDEARSAKNAASRENTRGKTQHTKERGSIARGFFFDVGDNVIFPLWLLFVMLSLLTCRRGRRTLRSDATVVHRR